MRRELPHSEAPPVEHGQAAGRGVASTSSASLGQRLLAAMPFNKRRSQPALGASELATAWQAVALLMDYPTTDLLARLDEIADAVGTLPEGVRTPLARLTAWLGSVGLTEAQERYVATFDHTRKCALHLTYYTFGDTRKRGVALVRFKQAYRAAGLELTDAELPDHLCVVCEFGASGPIPGRSPQIPELVEGQASTGSASTVDVAWKLLNENRAGLEILRLALVDRGSPWADGIVGLVATLPSLGPDEEAAVAKLLAEGPPNEDVGMDAYALDPRLNPHPAADEDILPSSLASPTGLHRSHA